MEDRISLMQQLSHCYNEVDLAEEKKYIERLLDKGFIDESDYEILMEYFHKMLDKLNSMC